MGEIPAGAREHVLARSGGLCERCGAPGTDVHHRRRRREGESPHAVVNLLRLCRSCHDRAHAHPLEALEHGVIVSPTVDPAAVPVRLKLWGVLLCDVFLTPDGYGAFASVNGDPL